MKEAGAGDTYILCAHPQDRADLQKVINVDPKKCPPKIATTLMKFSIGKLQRTAFARILPNIFTLTCIRAERTLPT